MTFPEKCKAVRKKVVITNNGDRPLNVDVSKHHAVEALPYEVIKKTIMKMKKGAALCIDAWSPMLFQQMLGFGGDLFLERLAKILELILAQKFGRGVLEMLTATRGVALPKPEDKTSVRPVSLSSLWMRILSSVITRTAAMKVSSTQYAFARDGCAQIGFRLREEIAAGKAILRFDIKNAFSSLRRTLAYDTIKMHEDVANLSPNVMNYFLLRSNGPTKMVMFGPRAQSIEVIDIPTGLQQGDSLSTVLYSACVDRVLTVIMKAKGHKISAVCQFVDDTIIACDPECALEISSFVRSSFEAFGFTINMTKSKIFSKHAITPNLVGLDEMEMADVAQMCPDEMREAVVAAARQELLSRAGEDGATFGAPSATSAAGTTATTTTTAAAHGDASAASDAAQSRELDPTVSDQLEAIRRREAEGVCAARVELVKAVCNSRLDKLRAVQQQGQQQQEQQQGQQQGQGHDGSLGAAAALGARRSDFDYYMSVIEKQPVELQQSGSFVAVGINISDDFADFNETQKKKHEKYWQIMDSLPALHLSSATKFTLLRLCAFPKVIFYASTTPPQHAAEIIENFQTNLIARVTELMGVVWTDANREAIFQRQGCGLPDLVLNAGKLYEDAQERYRNNNYKRVNSLSELSGCLAHSSVDIALTDLGIHLARQNSAAWFFTALRGPKHLTLPDVEFKLCMAIRCYALLLCYSFAARDKDGNKINQKFECARCQTVIDTDQKYIDHIFSSCVGNASYYVRRHNRLRDQIASVMRTYGASVETEPTLFINSYADNKSHRPDLLVNQAAMSATDFSIANTTASNSDKDEVRVSAEKKRRLHFSACNEHEVNFYPYVVSIHGWLDHSCWRFIRHVADQMSFELRDEFVFNMLQTTSVSLARSRADMIKDDFVARRSVSFSRKKQDSDDEGENEEEQEEQGSDGDEETENERNPNQYHEGNPTQNNQRAYEAGERKKM